MEMLCERLKEKRKRANLTQEKVAQILGISRSTYAYYETGKNEPDLKALIKLADLYETSIDYLTGRYN